ncbi:MAG: hypothetical protein ACREQK_01105 [Candidatus Binatia bacterium]
MLSKKDVASVILVTMRCAAISFGLPATGLGQPSSQAEWDRLLSKEGQEFYGRAMEASTRRLDVDSRWLVARGTRPAKDFLTLEEYHRVRNHLEDKVVKVRWPSAKFAEAILK